MPKVWINVEDVGQNMNEWQEYTDGVGRYWATWGSTLESSEFFYFVQCPIF
jgi:hypothetical protein